LVNEVDSSFWARAARLPATARRSLARALTDDSGRELPPEALDPSPYELVNLHTESMPTEDFLAHAEALAGRARGLGSGAPMVRIGDKAPAAALLVSGDHIWDLARSALELAEALDALAAAVAASCASGATTTTIDELWRDT
jgi:hypothetical protein